MYPLNVSFEIRFSLVVKFAHIALEADFIVHVLVRFQVTFSCKFFLANVAFEVFLRLVQFDMWAQVSHWFERLAAKITDEIIIQSSVHQLQVNSHVLQCLKTLVASFRAAFEVVRRSMSEQVTVEIVLLRKRFFTYTANFDQIGLRLVKCFPARDYLSSPWFFTPEWMSRCRFKVNVFLNTFSQIWQTLSTDMDFLGIGKSLFFVLATLSLSSLLIRFSTLYKTSLKPSNLTLLFSNPWNSAWFNSSWLLSSSPRW